MIATRERIKTMGNKVDNLGTIGDSSSKKYQLKIRKTGLNIFSYCPHKIWDLIFVKLTD